MELILFFAGLFVFWLISAAAVGIIFRNSGPNTSHSETKASKNKVYKPRLNQNELDKLSSTKIAATLNKTTPAKELKKLNARQKARDKAIYTYWSRRIYGTDFLGTRRSYYRWESPHRHTTVYYPISSYNRFMELKANREKHFK